MPKRSLGDPIPHAIVLETAHHIQEMYDVPEARSMRLAARALNAYESKGGWVKSYNKEIKSVLEVVVSKWIENGLAADAHDSWFEGEELIVSGKRFKMSFPIYDIAEYDDRIVVLFVYSADDGIGQFKNLIAVDREGNEIWKAEHPSTDSSSAYVKIDHGDPLVAWNFSGHKCSIDLDSGRIIDTVFTK